MMWSGYVCAQSEPTFLTCTDVQKFQDMAAEDKTRYKEEMKSYVPPAEETASKDTQDTSASEKSQVPAEANSAPKKKPKKRKRDPNKPKGAKSGARITRVTVLCTHLTCPTPSPSTWTGLT